MPTAVSIILAGFAFAALLTLAAVRAVLFFAYRGPWAAQAERIARAQEFTDRLHEQGLTLLYVGRELEITRKQMERYSTGKDTLPKHVRMALEQLIQTRQSAVLQIRHGKPALTVIRGGKAAPPASTAS